MATRTPVSSLLAASAALMLVLGAGAAEAQRAPRRHAPLSVSGFAPTSGPAGTEVTVSGSGFSRQTSVALGARRARVTSFGPGHLTFVIPPHYAGEPIVVGRGRRAVSVGSFAVVREPSLRRAPAGMHRIGSRVVLHGSDLRPGDVVLLAGRPLPIVRLAPNRIVVSIPEGASSGELVLARPSTQQRWRTGLVLSIGSAPAITSIMPSSGAPGARVRLALSEALSSADRIYFGETPVAIVDRGLGWVDVIVPAIARSSASFSVRGPEGSSSYAQPFTLRLPAPLSIASISPRRTANGVELTIAGHGFDRDAQVVIGNRVAHILSWSPNRIVALAPPTAPMQAPITVRSGGELASQIPAWAPRRG